MPELVPKLSRDNAEIRKDQEDPWVMYLIVRSSLNMSAGKIAAQVGHAVSIMHEYYSNEEYIGNPTTNIDYVRFYSWLTESFRKVVLTANDSKWAKIKEQLPCFVVRDAGLTQVIPNSETVIGLWPMKKSERPSVIKKCQTLK